MRTSALVVMNHRAAADEALRSAVFATRERGVDLHVRVCWEDGDGERFASRASELGTEIVIAAGGDGTLNQCVNGRWAAGDGSDLPVGLLPFGTANDFAGGLGIGRVDPAVGLRGLLENEPVPVDVGVVGVRRFVNVATGGFAASVTTGTSSGMKKILGGAAYFLNALGEVGRITAEPLRVRGPGWGWEGDSYLVAVANGRRAGGGFMVCSDASVRDGLLDVMLIPEVPDAELLRMFGDLLRTGGSLEHEDVWMRQGTWVEIETEKEIQLNLDGEPIFGHDFRFEVVPGALPLVLPVAPSTTMLDAEPDR